jgi:hypothetical protein
MVRSGMADHSPPNSKVQAGIAASVERDRLVKELIEKQRAETDAKTARLRALRLAKEAADQAMAPPPGPKPRGRSGR